MSKSRHRERDDVPTRIDHASEQRGIVDQDVIVAPQTGGAETVDRAYAA